MNPPWGLDTGGGESMKGLMEVGLKSSGLSLTLDLEERKQEEGCVESPEMTTVASFTPALFPF